MQPRVMIPTRSVVDADAVRTASNGTLTGTAFLLGNGWTEVYSVAGGMDAWERAGLEVRRGPLAPGEGDLGA